MPLGQAWVAAVPMHKVLAVAAAVLDMVVAPVASCPPVIKLSLMVAAGDQITVLPARYLE